MIRWDDNMGARGFPSKDAAQQHIDRVCMMVAPDLKYEIELEF